MSLCYNLDTGLLLCEAIFMHSKNIIKWRVYFKTITFSLLVTCIVGYFNMTYALNVPEFLPRFFIAPALIGLLFGVMTGRIILLNYKLKWFSVRDPLTHAYNHRHYKEVLNDWSQERSSFCLILIDVDHFKKINDQYGHNVGDQVLVRLSEVIEDIKRFYDVFARHGGEEFVLLTPRTSLSEAEDISLRLCKVISETTMPSEIKITCSFGVAEFKNDVDTADSIFDRADKSLYDSKRSGRNCVTTEKKEV